MGWNLGVVVYRWYLKFWERMRLFKMKIYRGKKVSIGIFYEEYLGVISEGDGERVYLRVKSE